MTKQLKDQILKQTEDGFISLESYKQISKDFNLSFKEIETYILSIGINPARYRRNMATVSTSSQLKLLHSSVAIIGSGGLGGHIAEMLVRIGVGNLSLFDFDIFEEHNLNRQNFCTIESLGKPKAQVVKESLEKINPISNITAYIQKFDPIKDMDMIQKCDIVIDALDNSNTKLSLSKSCKENNIHFIHGAVGGFSGQVASDATLENIYRNSDGGGAEIVAGNPSFNVTFVASLQASEAVKTLLGLGSTLKEKLLITDLNENEFYKLDNL